MVTTTETWKGKDEYHVGLIYIHAPMSSAVSYLAPADPTAKLLTLLSHGFSAGPQPISTVQSST